MKSVKIIWNNRAHKGTIEANNAVITTPIGHFDCEKLTVSFESASLGIGGIPTIVNVLVDRNPFSFILRDVSSQNPIYVPEYEVIVTTAVDIRSYEQIVRDIKAKGGKTKLQLIEEQEEYSFQAAIKEVRDLPGPAWLGVSKDFRIFEVGLRSKSCGNDEQTYDYILPRHFWIDAKPYELKDYEPRYSMMSGRGIGCKHEVSKRLEEGYMPILNAQNIDEGIVYNMQYFATLETSPLDSSHLRGTDMYAADAYGAGHMFTEAQQKYVDEIIDKELNREEETVMFVKVTAENITQAPTFSYVKIPDPVPRREYERGAPKMEYDGSTGFLTFSESGRVCCIATVDGSPVPQEEMVVLLAPGEKISYTYKLPHQPVSYERAQQLSAVDYDVKLDEAKAFWRNELEGAAKVSLPEKRIEEMIKAGLLHMDVGYFGKNPDEAVVPIVGVYTAIGSESSPGIQFLDTMGMHDLAARALQFFVEKQHEDGFMQNFGGYMLETGSVLWSMGEHYRLTRDSKWVESVRDSIIKACEYLIRWREQNLGDELKDGRGYGMIAGKIADPNDMYHSFMLNANTYAGLSRASEMLACCDMENSKRYKVISEEMRGNIRESFIRNVTISQLIPMGDGTWSHSFSPWTEYVGPAGMYAKGGKWYTHGTFTARDMIVASYLILQEVIDPNDPLADIILNYYTEHLTLNNTCFSQPYYSPHPYAHAMRGEVKLFLKEFYSGFASLADRETYSFWEHHYHVSQHKLHEEGWFLMRCRWMLCLEDFAAKQLNLLSMVPRNWLEDGKEILVQGMKSYFGTVNYTVKSKLGIGRVMVLIKVESGKCPQAEIITIRIPHPESKKARFVTEGKYCPDTETITFDHFDEYIECEVIF